MSTAVALKVGAETRHVCGLLKEYAEKLVHLRRQEGEFGTERFGRSERDFDQLAWWLDECERMKKPLLEVVSWGSQTLEHLELEPLVRDELTLRLAEIEVHLHHTLRRHFYWKERVSNEKHLKARIDPLRMSAGLPGE